MDIIHDEVIIFRRDQSKTNVTIEFKLKKDYDTLEIYCEYSPKKVDDMVFTKQALEDAAERFFPKNQRPEGLKWEDYAPLSNLLTFSLDYEDTYLGCAHRQAAVQKQVICENSSFGFENHKPLKGNYFAVINAHAVNSLVVTYHLKVIAK